MKAQLFKLTLLVVLFSSLCLSLPGCSDKTQNPPVSRIVGDLSKTATLEAVVQPADCSDVAGANSSLDGRLNNVNLDKVKIVMYTTGGLHYGNVRVFANDGTFSMPLPCDRRIRLVLADSGWTNPVTLSDGPPDVADLVLATYWDIGRVVGGISGLVRSTFDNSLVQDVEVSWTIEGSVGKDTTGAGGFFVVGSTVPPGTHELLFSKAGFAELIHSGVIPTLEEIQGQNNPYPGDLAYVVNLEVRMPPLTANLSGHISRIDPVSSDTVAAANIEVQLLLNENITTNLLKDTTDANGLYSFDEVPSTDTLSLVVPSFVVEAYTYGPVDSTFDLFPGPTIMDVILSAGGGGSYLLISEPDRR